MIRVLLLLAVAAASHAFVLRTLGIWQIQEDSAPVSVELYYESLCGGCRYFVETQLYPTFFRLRDTGILKIAMVPYGNAKETQNPDGSWSFECQHGDAECRGNLLEVCIMKYLGMDSDAYLPVISCMEGSDDPVASARGCVAALSNLTFKDIKTCAQGPEGNALMHAMGLKTESLDPPHNYVPWLLIDGVHNDTIQNLAIADLTALVCQTYQGAAPRQCQT